MNNANPAPARPRCKPWAASLLASMLVGAVLAGMVPAQVAAASPEQDEPSVDCKKAATQTEKAVCGDRELKKLDREVAQIVSRLLHKYDSPDAQEELFELQRKWQKASDAQCSGVSDITGCLKERYRAHYDHLKHWTPSK